MAGDSRRQGAVQSDDEKRLRAFLGKAKFRLFRQTFLRLFSRYAFFGVAAAFIISVVEIFVPFYYAGMIELLLLFASFICAFVHCLVIFPSDLSAAKYVDSTGLKERLTTSVELFGHEDELSVLQRADTWNNVKDFSFKYRLPFCWYYKRYIAVLALLFVMCICVLLPSDAKRMAKTVHEFAKLEGGEEEKIDKALEELKKKEESGDITGEKYDELKKALEDAREQIKESENSLDIEKAKERLAKKIRDSLSDEMGEELADSLQSLAGKYNLSELSKYQKQLSELAGSSDTLEKYKDGLKDLGDMMSDEERKALLEEIKKKMEDGELTPSELKDALNATGNANAQVAASTMNEVTGTTGNGGDGNNENNNNNNNNNNNGSANNGNNGSENGNGNNNSNAGGNGNDGGGGGKGNGGVGAGGGKGYNYGSTKGYEDKDNGKSGEDVTVTKKKGNDGKLTGKKDGNGGKTSGKTKGSGWTGNKVGLDTVIGEYKDEAYSKIGNNKIPAGMDSVVKEYFGGLAGD